MSHPLHSRAAQLARRFLSALALAGVSLPVLAAESPAVPLARADARALCPDIEGLLADALAGTARKLAHPAAVELELTIEDQRIARVRALSGPDRLQRAVQRTLTELQCQAPAGQPQLLQLTVRFVDAASVAGRPAIQLAAGSAARR